MTIFFDISLFCGFFIRWIQVGEGIAQAIAEGVVTRKELWITSKLWKT